MRKVLEYEMHVKECRRMAAQMKNPETFALVRGLIQRDYPFSDKEEAHRFFTQLTGLLKNLNYTARNTPEYKGYLTQIDELVKTLGRASAAKPDAQVGLYVGTSSSSPGRSTERPTQSSLLD
jgi:hypothetical protein